MQSRDKLWSSEIEPFTVSFVPRNSGTKTVTLSYVFERKLDEQTETLLKDVLVDMMSSTDDTNDTCVKTCYTCKDFLVGPSLYVDKNCRGPLDVCTHEPYISLANYIRNLPVCMDHVKFITLLDIGHKQCGKNATTGEPYFHLATRSKNMSENYRNINDYDISVRHWLPTFKRVFGELASEDTLRSMETCMALLKKVTYGDKLLGSAKWFYETMKSYMDASSDDCKASSDRHHDSDKRDRNDCRVRQLEVLVNAMLPNLVKGASNLMDCPVMSQFNKNTRNAMEVAHDEAAFRKIIKERLDPTNYMRPTTEASASQLLAAADIIGDFSSKIMTLEDFQKIAADYPDTAVYVPCYDNKSKYSTPASILIDEAKSKNAGKKGNKMFGSFADRCKTKIRTIPKTFRELVSLSSEDLVGLQVNVEPLSHPVYMTTYPDSCRCLFGPSSNKGYLWAFFQEKFGKQKLPRRFYIRKKWNNVSGIMFIGRSVFVGVYGAKITEATGATYSCFPESLSTEYARTIRKPMEKLCSKPVPLLPGTSTTSLSLSRDVINESSKQCMAGIGTSRAKGEKALTSISFRFVESSDDVFYIDMF